MKLARHNVNAIGAMLILALFATNLAVGSLHLCFDGQEPPVTLHALSDTLLHGDGGPDHVDRDVEAAKATPVKLLWHGVDLAPLVSLLVLQALPLLTHAQNNYDSPIGRSNLSFVRPRLRAPPL
jgi:hypothetical protein